MNEKLEQMLKDWNDPCGAQTLSDATDLINELQIELGGKDGLIKALREDLEYYKAAHAERQKGLGRVPPHLGRF